MESPPKKAYQTLKDSIAVNFSDLERLTGVTYKTLQKRLQTLTPVERNDSGVYFNITDALRRILKQQDADSDSLSLTSERAKLARAQTLKTRLENKKTLSELVDSSVVSELYTKHVIAARNKILGTPARLAIRLTNQDSPELIEQTIREVLEEALHELACDS